MNILNRQPRFEIQMMPLTLIKNFTLFLSVYSDRLPIYTAMLKSFFLDVCRYYQLGLL